MLKCICLDSVQSGWTCLANLGFRFCPVRKLICPVQSSPNRYLNQQVLNSTNVGIPKSLIYFFDEAIGAYQQWWSKLKKACHIENIMRDQKTQLQKALIELKFLVMFYGLTAKVVILYSSCFYTRPPRIIHFQVSRFFTVKFIQIF